MRRAREAAQASPKGRGAGGGGKQGLRREMERCRSRRARGNSEARQAARGLTRHGDGCLAAAAVRFVFRSELVLCDSGARVAAGNAVIGSSRGAALGLGCRVGHRGGFEVLGCDSWRRPV